MMTIHYRVAAIADLTTLLELVEEFHQHEKLPFDATLDREVLRHFLTDESFGRAWLIEQDDAVIGYLVLTLSFSVEYRGRDAFIDELYLRPQYRGQGIGTQLLAFAEAACRRLKVRALHLEVHIENPDAQRFYHRAGYQNYDRLLMTKQFANHAD